MCVCVCVCAFACVRACVCVRLRACVHACVSVGDTAPNPNAVPPVFPETILSPAAGPPTETETTCVSDEAPEPSSI